MFPGTELERIKAVDGKTPYGGSNATEAIGIFGSAHRPSWAAWLSILFVQLVTAINGLPVTRYVDGYNPVPTAPYTDWSTAATNIQDAIDIANPGDEVIVTNGVYRFGGALARDAQTNRIALIKPIVLRSVNGPAVTRIEGAPDGSGGTRGAVRCAYVGTNSILSGFTLTNGYALDTDSGGGVWCEASGVVTNCTFRGNLAGWKGGGAWGGKLYNCVFTDNSAMWGGGAWSATLYNCVLVSNTAWEVGGGAGQCGLYNCTVVANSAVEYGGGVWDCAAYNSIVYYNDASGNYYPFSYGSFDYSCTDPLPSRGVGNIASAPLFVDLARKNLRLQPTSMCRDVASNSYTFGGFDLDGRLRIVNATADMGAYEFQPGVNGEFIAWLQRYVLPTDGSADNSDFDADQMNHWQEWRAGTDPTNPRSVLRLLTPLRRGSEVVVQWESIAGRSYFLQSSAELSAPFIMLATNISGEQGLTSYTNTFGGSFYRVGVE